MSRYSSGGKRSVPREDRAGAGVERRLSRRQLLTRGVLASGAALAAKFAGPGLAFGAVSPKRFRIAIVPKGLDNPVFALAKLGSAQRAKELGDVEPIFTASSTTDTAGDINVIEGLISSRVDAIGISCNDPVAYVPVINKAIAAGIACMTWDSDAPTSKRLCFYGVDSYAVGQKMGVAIKRLITGRGNIVIVSGDAAALNLNLRIRGVRSTIGPGIKVLNVYYTKDDIPTAIAATENAIRAYRNLNGIVMVGGWALFSNEGATPLLNKSKLKVVSFDPLQATVTYLRDDIVQSVWTQDYWGWGYETTTILYGILQGKRWHTLIPQPSLEVTPKDAPLWEQRWAATAKGMEAAAAVWGEAPFTPPGPGTGPLTPAWRTR